MKKIYTFYTLSTKSDIENIRYVGVTTKTIDQRLYHHKYCAKHETKRGLPVHKWMFSHYEKGDDIIITKIDECDISCWEDREKYWINHYKNLGFELMNISEGGCGVITKEMREQSSIDRSSNKHKKAIIALLKDGTFYKEFDSIKQATEELGLRSHSAIGNVLKGRAKSSGGYLWVYKKDYDESLQYTYNKIEKGTKVYEFEIDGTLLNVYPSKKYFEKLDGWSFNGVQSAIKNKTIYHDHYWSTNDSIDISEYEPYFYYQEIDSDGNIIEMFRTQQEICDKYNISPAVVCTNIKENKLIKGNKISKL